MPSPSSVLVENPSPLIERGQNVIDGDMTVFAGTRIARINGLLSGTLTSMPPGTLFGNLFDTDEPGFPFDANIIAGTGLTYDLDIANGPFPVVIAESAQAFPASSLTMTVTLPGSRKVNDKVIIGTQHNGANTVTTPAGWTLLGNIALADSSVNVYERILDGTEPSTLTITSSIAGATLAKVWVVRYSVNSIHSQVVTQSNTSTGGTSNDLGSLSPTWGTANTLWLTFIGIEADDTSPPNITAFPSGFGSTGELQNVSGTAALDGAIGWGWHTFRAASLDPTAFTYAASRSGAFLIAVPPRIAGAFNATPALPGAQGAPGRRGDDAPRSPLIPGIQGLTGPIGPPGAGNQGPPGRHGEDAPRNILIPGATGATGGAGATGAQGTPGLGMPGRNGEDSPRNPLIPGATGATGIQGIAGTAGVSGPPARNGEDSPRNPLIPGATGATGIQGLTGSIGATGLSGPPARNGEDSPRNPLIPGPSGINGTVGATGAAGQSTVGSPGRNGEDAPRSLLIPGSQGIPGTTGSVGATGVSGPPSRNGEDSPRNPLIPGIQGIQGLPGIAGSSGVGLSGPPGRDGEDARRPMLIPGTPGAAGAPGASGVIGSVLNVTSVNFGVPATSGNFLITGLSGLVTNTPIMVTLAVDIADPTGSEQQCWIVGIVTSSTTISCYWNSGSDLMSGIRKVQYITSTATGNLTLSEGQFVGLAITHDSPGTNAQAQAISGDTAGQLIRFDNEIQDTTTTGSTVDYPLPETVNYLNFGNASAIDLHGVAVTGVLGGTAIAPGGKPYIISAGSNVLGITCKHQSATETNAGRRFQGPGLIDYKLYAGETALVVRKLISATTNQRIVGRARHAVQQDGGAISLAETLNFKKATVSVSGGVATIDALDINGSGWQDDFTTFASVPASSVYLGDTPWNAYFLGGTASIAGEQDHSDMPGVWTLFSGTTANNFMAISKWPQSSPNSILLQNVSYYCWRVQSGDVVTQTRVEAGLVSNMFGAEAEGAIFRVDSTTGTPTWHTFTRKGAGTAENFDTGISYTVSTNFTLEIEVTSVAGVVSVINYFINGTNVRTVSNTAIIPTNYMMFCCGILSVTNSTRNLLIDYAAMRRTTDPIR